MRDYKHIEAKITRYISIRYQNVVEIGIGRNFSVALGLRDAGLRVRCTDISPALDDRLDIRRDDVLSPDPAFYAGADLLYAVRPGIEMVPPMILLARRCGCPLLVYHLGNEIYGNGGRIVDCGVVLHYYYDPSRPSCAVPSETVEER
ncbi:MAG: hypothetical protein APR53_03875 [Methanoculleus sp. SDB]|nr:MAG: hypothetical protein APR53_03875 [Methanoculleus sp. SDB]